MKKILIALIALLMTTSLFASKNKDYKGFFEVGMSSNKFTLTNDNYVEKNTDFSDSFGLDMNYLDRITDKISMGFRANYTKGDIINDITNESLGITLMDINVLMKYDFVNNNKFQFGPLSTVGWDYVERENDEYNFLYLGVGLYTNYYLNKSIAIGFSAEYRYTISSDITKDNVDINLNDSAGTYWTIPLSIQMDKTSWFVFEYSSKSINMGESDEISNDSIAAKIRWIW